MELTPSSGQFGNQNYLGTLETGRTPGNRTDTGYTELSREVAPPPKKCQEKQIKT